MVTEELEAFEAIADSVESDKTRKNAAVSQNSSCLQLIDKVDRSFRCRKRDSPEDGLLNSCSRNYYRPIGERLN